MDRRGRRALGIVIAAALTTAAVMNGGNSRSTDDSPLPWRPSTTTTAPRDVHAPHPTTTTVDLCQAARIPTRRPADPYAPGPIIQIGTIEIPKIGLVHPIFEGIRLTVIDHGPGHWPGSAMPCQAGNTVFPGHRVTHTHPFLNLDLLAPGDQIVFHMPGTGLRVQGHGYTDRAADRHLGHRPDATPDGDPDRVQPQAQRGAAHRREGEAGGRYPPTDVSDPPAPRSRRGEVERRNS